VPDRAGDFEQAYDFSAGELITRFTFKAAEVTAGVEVLTFCCRGDPSLVCQETKITVSRACSVSLRAMIDVAGVAGGLLYQSRETPGESEPAVDGSLLWESEGGFSTC
jgi:hypothetical protein